MPDACRLAGDSTASIRLSCKAGCVARRRSPAPPVGFIVVVESVTAPPCLFMFGPSRCLAASLLRPLLTSVRSRRESLPAALCRCPVRCLFARLRRATRRSAWALVYQFRPFWIYGSVRHRYARQISPGKNAMFPCTSAAFTVGAVPMGFAVMCQLASAPSAFYAVSVRRLARLHSGFLRTSPRELALAFG